MKRRRGIVALLVVAVALISSTTSVAKIRSDETSSASPTPLSGKALYRKYCGQCHVLTAALAAGFGSNNGLGTNGGPSFDSLRVPFGLAVLAVRQPFIGHEVLVRKMTWEQITKVATFVASATRRHRVVARFTDG
jgi:mono/diheme cytochrome c family protein